MRETTDDIDPTRNIVRELRRRIVAWQYPPQFQLVEETLAQEFGVSRSPIRQALTYLTAEGLVERLPRRGFHVRQMKLRDVEDLYEFRLALETQVVSSLAHTGLKEETLFRLQAMWQDPDALAAAPVSKLAELDESYHLSLAQEHGNKLIIRHLNNINERLFAFRELDFEERDRLGSTCDEHGRILRAIVSHDVSQACDLLKRNIHSALGNVENAVIKLVGRSYLNPDLATSEGMSS